MPFRLLERRGRPTAVILLLLVVVAQLALALRRHAPLGLEHLLGLAGAARRLVTLRRVEGLQVRRREGARVAAEVITAGASAYGVVAWWAGWEEGLAGWFGDGQGRKQGGRKGDAQYCSGKERAGVPRGTESRRAGALKAFPLLKRFSIARSTSGIVLAPELSFAVVIPSRRATAGTPSIRRPTSCCAVTASAIFFPRGIVCCVGVLGYCERTL